MKQRLAVLALALAAGLVAEPAFAVPAFARRYKVECHFCHEGYPKLNQMGQRFKERGFRMEREDDFDAAKWAASIPVTVRGEGRIDFDSNGHSWSIFGKAISAGSLGKRISYWVDDAVFRAQGDDGFTHVKPGNAWGRIELIEGGKFYVKGGRIELDLPFTQTRTPHLFGYDIYSANTGLERDAIGSYQEGVELGAELPDDWRVSAAVVKGRNSPAAEAFSDQVGKFDGNVFLRVSKRVDRHRFGAYAYIGRNTLALSKTIVWDDSLLRLGADANLWFEKLNVYGTFIYGRNSNPVATAAQPTGTSTPLDYNGGFLQADYHLNDIVALTARVNLVNKALTATDRDTSAGFFPGVQVFIFEHGKVSFEYGFPNQSRKSFGAVQAEFAF